MKTGQYNVVNPYMVIDPPRQSVIYPKENFLNESDCTTYTLSKEEELRIELSKGESVRIIVESGYAEIEGAEIPLNYPLNFSNTKLSIFCWADSKIKVEGHPTYIYPSSSNKSSMNQYLLTHCIINDKRNESLARNKLGPNVLITGSNSSGKSNLCHILLNYALKLGWTPIFVDLDPSNEISVPGTISATPVDFTVPNEFMIDNSISLFNGSNVNDLNLFLYEKQINEMASIIRSKLEYDLESFLKKFNITNKEDKYGIGHFSSSDQSETSIDESVFVSNQHPTLYASGTIINCPMILSSKDNMIFKNIIEEFDIDFVFVIENEKLFNVIKTIYAKYISSRKNLEISLLDKKQGINHDSSYKEWLEQKKFDSYFKGPFNNLKITEFKIDLNTYKLIQIMYSNVTSAILPIGSKSELNILLREVNLDENLLHRIVAILHLEDKVINDLDNNYNEKLNFYVDKFARAPVSFMAYMYL